MTNWSFEWRFRVAASTTHSARCTKRRCSDRYLRRSARSLKGTRCQKRPARLLLNNPSRTTRVIARSDARSFASSNLEVFTTPKRWNPRGLRRSAYAGTRESGRASTRVPPGARTLCISARASTMPLRAIHQSVHERITRSKAASGYGRRCAAPAAKRTFRTPALRAFLFAAAMASGSGSSPSTLVANVATPSANRPSPHPRSRTRFLRTSDEPPHSLSSSWGRGRRAEDCAGTRMPRSPTESCATRLIGMCRLNRVGHASSSPATAGSGGTHHPTRHASAGTGGHSAAVVGRARFELAISWSQTRRFSGLSYRPRFLSRLILDRLAGVSKKVADTDVHIRPMLEADLDAVLEITNSAFCELVERTTGRRPAGPMFASGLGRYRLSLDPLGCHVAVRGDEVVGANFSVLRGTLGWFGPLAVRPDAQGLGIAQLLVQEFVRSAGERGATLMGLETMANSPQHVHLYMKLGFRPSWTGISFRREARAAKLLPGVEIDGAAHELNYVYPGCDAANDVRATRSVKTGVSLRFGDGLAVCHTVSTLWADPTIAYVPLIAAPDRETFDVLVRAVEAVAREHGKMRVVTQVPW